MLEVEVAIPPRVRLAGVEKTVKAACDRAGLHLTLIGTLAKYPGCVHWHFKHGAERGTLEITFWKTERRLWFKVTAGRKAKWIETVIPSLRRVLEKELKRNA